MKTADTDGLLDRCECGVRAGINKGVSACGNDGYIAQCTECAESTGVYLHKIGAIIAWNKQQRRNKGTIQ